MDKPCIPIYRGSRAELELAPAHEQSNLAVAQRILIMRAIWDMGVAFDFVKRWMPKDRQGEILAAMLTMDYIMWLREKSKKGDR